MNWFQHDTDSTQDAKIKKLLIRHGAVGYAIYFHCLELIASEISESNLTFELEHDSEIIADNLKIKGNADHSGRDIVENIMRDIISLGLFTQVGDRIFCIKLLKRINLSMTSSASFREAIALKKEQYHDTIMTHRDDIMLPTLPTNTTNQPTKNMSKKTDEKPKKYSESFESFWSLYPKKVSKGQAERTYSAMMKRGVAPDSILSCLQNYLDEIRKTNKETQFIKNPSTFLNNYLDYEKPSPEVGRSPKVVFQSRPKCECGGEFNPGGFCTKCGREIS